MLLYRYVVMLYVVMLSICYVPPKLSRVFVEKYLKRSAEYHYHSCRHIVDVICSHIALAVIGSHNSRQTPIQCHVCLGICGENQ